MKLAMGLLASLIHKPGRRISVISFLELLLIGVKRLEIARPGFLLQLLNTVVEQVVVCLGCRWFVWGVRAAHLVVALTIIKCLIRSGDTLVFLLGHLLSLGCRHSVSTDWALVGERIVEVLTAWGNSKPVLGHVRIRLNLSLDECHVLYVVCMHSVLYLRDMSLFEHIRLLSLVKLLFLLVRVCMKNQKWALRTKSLLTWIKGDEAWWLGSICHKIVVL